jgi:hypothetical protein
VYGITPAPHGSPTAGCLQARFRYGYRRLPGGHAPAAGDGQAGGGDRRGPHPAGILQPRRRAVLADRRAGVLAAVGHQGPGGRPQGRQGFTIPMVTRGADSWVG